MKKKVVVLLLVLALCLGACGPKEPAKESSAPAPESTSAGESTSVEETSSSGQATSEKKAVGKGSGEGMNGPISVEVSFTDDKIEKIEVGENKETEGLGTTAIDALKGQVIEHQSVKLDIVSGATLSSNGFLDAVSKAIVDSGRDTANYQAAAEATSGTDKKEMETDVVVVGGGGAGFAAAITAKEKGAKVVLLEKLNAVGGNTMISGGEYAAPGNAIQEKEGIEDSPELFAKDVEKAGGDPTLIRVLSEHALDGTKWLKEDIGVEWLEQLMFFGGHSVKRAMIPKGHSGVELIQKYTAKAKSLGIDVLTNHDVKEILQQDGKISGVKVKTPEGELTVHAKAVVLASGGFGANDEMCYQYDKEIDDKILSTNSVGAQGDGIVMAEKLGADTVDMDKIQLYPICDVDTGKLLYVGDTRLVGGAMLVNKEGKRFVEELDTRRAISMGIKAQSDSKGYLIWDEKSSVETGTIVSHAAEAESLYARGYLKKADTIEELAKHFGIDEKALKETVDNFNKNAKEGKDPDFNLRNVGWTIEEAPYYMLVAVPAVHHTMGGLKINTETQVLDKSGNAIEGLFAAGEVTGGIHGSNRLGSAAMADITVFGRIAGENAAAFAAK